MIEKITGYVMQIPIQSGAVLLFIIAYFTEYLVSKTRGMAVHIRSETMQNFSIGAISFALEFFMALCSYPFLQWIYAHATGFHFNSYTVLNGMLLFILLDFTEYLFHFCCHKVNLLWAAHVVHHQSTSFNLSVGFRTSFFIYFFNVLFYAISPLLGFDPKLLFTFIVIQGTYQLLLHTELVGRLGWLEYLLVTPSGHRVHHGCNDKYMDRNFGKTLIIWDRIFGTYEKEKESVIYGTTESTSANRSFAIILEPYRKLAHQIRKDSKKVNRILFYSPNVIKRKNEAD